VTLPIGTGDASWVTLEVDDGTNMRAWVARPGGTGAHPAIIVIQEAFGVNGHIRDVAARYARRGFVAIAPEMFHRSAPGWEGRHEDMQLAMTHLQAMKIEHNEADLRAVHGWLVAEGSVDSARIAAVGFCMGGRVVFVANATLPLTAAVSYYGGGIAPGLLDRAPSLHGPHLFLWAGRDARILPEHHGAIAAALRASGKVFVNVEFSDAEHGFFSDERPPYQPRAAHESWALVQRFLDDHVLGAIPRDPPGR
jgi:carboxymethylenebutenolidase